MNERIKGLAKQAGYNASWHTKADREECFDIEKFAELIIEECIKQARKDENGLAYEAVGRIADHFGIE
jgi:hypothetical protein